MEDLDKFHCKASLADNETENIAICIYDASFGKGFFSFSASTLICVTAPCWLGGQYISSFIFRYVFRYSAQMFKIGILKCTYCII